MEEKINPELLLAIGIDEYRRGSSLYLGYDVSDDSWTLILRYSGDISDLENTLLNRYVYLLGGFAIINIYTDNIQKLQRDPRVLYIDKANYYSYGVQYNSYERYSACVSDQFTSRYDLTGEGVCVGIIDSGVDIRNAEFMSDGESRVVYYWDQNMPYNSEIPNRYGFGRIYGREEINEEEYRKEISETIMSTHGTEVCSVAAGATTGIAVKSEILVVEQAADRNMPDTISIMMGIDFLVRYSMESGKPMVINLSYGNNYGAHDGSSILENYIDIVSQMARISIVTGTGNDGAKELHANGLLGNVSFEDLDIAVSSGVNNFGVQIWKSYTDIFDVIVYSPSYEAVLYLTEGQISSGIKYQGTVVYGIFQSPTPYNAKQMIYIFFQSEKYVSTGTWRIRLFPKSIMNGLYNAYLPNDSYVTGRLSFDRADVFGTLTIPSTSRTIISVAAYDQKTGGIASFSGRGFTTDNGVKPDIAAPGVGITVAVGESDRAVSDGTSVSAAFVTGCSALLMEWGIVRGNDPFMYGEKLKAQLIRGAKPLGNVDIYPNRYVGWGTLCLEESFRGLIV